MQRPERATEAQVCLATRFEGRAGEVNRYAGESDPSVFRHRVYESKLASEGQGARHSLPAVVGRIRPPGGRGRRVRRAKGKKWSNLGKMLCARTRAESDLETMKELINTIVQKTGMSQEDAQKTVQVVVGFLKTKMPTHFSQPQLDSIPQRKRGIPQQTGDFLKPKVGEVVDTNR